MGKQITGSRNKRLYRTQTKAGILLLLLIFLAGCVHFISDYDTYSYKNLTDLKAETLVLLDAFAENPKSPNCAEKMDELKLHLEKAYQYEKGKKLNDNTIAQLGEIRKMVDGMIAVLKKQGGFTATYLEEKRLQLEEAFDMAIATESIKIRRGNF